MEILSDINYWAVLVSALSTFLIGGLWYGPLFGKLWQKENKLSDSDLQKGSPIKTFGLSFLLALISAANLAFFIGPESNLNFGLFAGAFTGLFFVSTFLGIIYLFEKKSLKLFLINSGYISFSFTIMGAILGAWK